MSNLLLFPLWGDEDEMEEAPRQATRPGAKVPQDAAAREQAMDVTRSWIVEAPAGSGKTGLLIQRYLKLLLDERVTEPEQILAITFTRAATAEVRERVVGELERAAAGEMRGEGFEGLTGELARKVMERNRQRGWRLLEETQRINVRTIDSVCAEIARSLPVLTSGGGRQAPRADANGLYREAARRTLLALGGADAALDRALRLALLHRDANLQDCERLIAEMLQHRDQWGKLVPVGPEMLTDEALETVVRPRLNQAMEQAICAVLTEISRAVPKGLMQRLTSAAAEMGHLEGYRGALSPIAICSGKHTPPGETAEHVAHWRALIGLLLKQDNQWRAGFNIDHVGFRTGKAEKARLKELIGEVQERDDLLDLLYRVRLLPPATYPQEQWEVAKALFRILSQALLELQLVFAETGECDFAEMALLARTALSSEGGMEQFEAATGRRLQHLLIDEMQDTSTSQYDLIGLLTQGWGGEGQTLFLVGDPKQSIYLFRQARVERFVETMRAERLGGVQLGRLRLTENFRSQPELVDQINESFEAILPGLEEAIRPEQVPFVRATAAREIALAGAQGAVWHATVLPSVSRDEEGAARRRQSRMDAMEVRRVIERWRSTPLPEGRVTPWTIAVLVRAKNDLREILPVLKREEGGGAVPFRAVEIDVLNERQEVLDVHALTRALLHPADRFAWLAVLRAPWCGLGLAELHLLTGEDDPKFRDRCVEELLDERGDLLGVESGRRLERVWPVLNAAGRRTELPLTERVERTWRTLGGEAWLGQEEMANVRQYLSMLSEVEATEGTVEVRELERRMQRLFAAASTAEDAVDLMTIHKAKGLEWDVVLVPEMDRGSPGPRSRLLEWEELTSGDATAASVVLAPVPGRGQDAQELNQWLTSLHRERAEAERMRLFYVVATRAREELHLFGAVQRTSKGEVKANPGSMLAAAWPAAKAHFAGRTDSEAEVIAMRPDDWQDREPEGPGVLIAVAAAGASAAASAADEERDRPMRPMLDRLPAGFDMAEASRGVARLPYGERTEATSAAGFDRPEGSVAARALGNAVHAFLEMATRRAEDDLTMDAVSGEVRGWMPRIEAVLQAEGLAPGTVGRLARQVMQALVETMADEVGRWILTPHAGAVTESQRTSWDGERRSIRVDRSFRAGAEPMAEGAACLWIVDYKTATHGAHGMDEFLAREKEKYRGQMEAYARVMGDGEAAVRVALYYPMVSRLVWWVPGEAVAGKDG